MAARIAERALGSFVAGLDVAGVGLSDVSEVWSAFDRIERLASSAKVLLAARVDESGVWKRAGARSAAEYLAQLGGTSTSEARRAIENSKQVATLPVVADAMRVGALSNAHVDAIVPAAATDPLAQGRLVGLAQTTNVTELREECLRTKAAADPDPDATHAGIRKNRRCKTYMDAEGAWNLRARGTAEQGVAFEAALEPIITGLFATARAEGRREPRAAYAFDALLSLADRDTAPKKRAGTKPRYLGILHIDLAAFVRGWTESDETC